MEGVINESSTVYCNGVYTFDTSPDPYWPKCTGHHGNISVVEAITKSCNIFFYDVGRRLEIEKINYYASLFGLGQSDTGLEIRNEPGQVASPELAQQNGEVWYQGNTWQAAIGQSETKITPLQMATRQDNC